MTGPITLPGGVRMAGDNLRMAAKAREGGEAEDFMCILGDCETAATKDLEDTTEDRDPAAAGEAQPASPARIDVATPLLTLLPQAIPSQPVAVMQSGTQAVSTAPALLAITMLNGFKADDPDSALSAADLETSPQAAAGYETGAPPEKNAALPNVRAFAPKAADETVTGNPKPSDAEAPSSRKDEMPLPVAPAARSPEQSTSVPPQPASPAAQILTRIAELAAPPEERPSLARSAPLTSAGTPDLAHSPSLRTLRIRLEPETLGEVEVTLRQTVKGVKVEILVAHSTTAETLARDLSLLEDKLSGLLGTSAAAAAVSISLQAGSPPEPRTVPGLPQGFTAAGPETGTAGGGSAGQRESRPQGNETPSHLDRTRPDEEEVAMRSPVRIGRVV